MGERGRDDLTGELLAMMVKGKGLAEAAASAGELLSLDFRDYASARRRALEALSSS